MMRRGGRQQLELLASPSFFLLLLLLGLTRVPVWPASPLTAPPYERSAQAAANCFALAQLQGAGDIYRHGLCSVVRRGEVIGVTVLRFFVLVAHYFFFIFSPEAATGRNAAAQCRQFIAARSHGMGLDL